MTMTLFCSNCGRFHSKKEQCWLQVRLDDPKWHNPVISNHTFDKKLKNSKAPKLRFRPGQFVQIKGEKMLFEIIYCFRVKGEIDWFFNLEERKGITDKDIIPSDPVGQVLQYAKLGSNTPRIVYEPFNDEMQAHIYFSNIWRNGSSITLLNKEMVQRATIVSSGMII